MRMAAIYARVSSDRQKEDDTIGSQLAALSDYARNEAFSVPEQWIFQDEGYSIKITASFGIATFPDDALSKDEVISMADNAMYNVKRRGRDNIYHASDLK